MNHLQEYILTFNDYELVLKPTHRALYKSLEEAKLGKRMLVLLEELQNLNYDVIFIVLKHMCVKKYSIDELMEMNIPLALIAEKLGNAIIGLLKINEKEESK